MKVSYNSLNKFFGGKLPAPSVVADALTFHAWEIEEVKDIEGDSVLDVKVLPDKSAWALSHRGIAKDLSVILNIPLIHDPLSEQIELAPILDSIEIDIKSETCRTYSAALITGVKVCPSPKWLEDTLRVLGQKPINNIVDITNYVMFGLGQPLHAFDAKKLGGTKIGVRKATDGESFTSLTGEVYTLTSDDTVIENGQTGEAVGIAGIKGGKSAEVDETTTDILLESANFEAVPVRKTAQRLKLRTDASTRYENGVAPEMTKFGIAHAVGYFVEVAGGMLQGFKTEGDITSPERSVSVSLPKINSVLGLSLKAEDVKNILERFGYAYSYADEVLSVTAPFERPDITIPEDLIEEIGRIHGYDHVASIPPEPLPLREYNKKFYYADKVRDALLVLGFSEVFTSSFRSTDTVKLKNALASDKGYLRSTLRENLSDALAKNAPMADLLGVDRARIFEIGTVFRDTERFMLALGVRSPSGYKAKTDDAILQNALESLKTLLGSDAFEIKEGIAEIELGNAIDKLPMPEKYDPFVRTPDITYRTFSTYPFSSRDIAFWTNGGVSAEDAETVIRDNAGTLLTRLTFVDKFDKDGKTSYAFRIVFQSNEKTLTEDEINSAMSRISSSVSAKGWEVR